jgi:hypothetical protein
MKIPAGIIFKDYYFPGDDISDETINKFILFVNTYNHVHGCNITRINREIFDNIRTIESGLTILLLDEMLIGTIITLIYPFCYKDIDARTSYTTYLCIHPKFRNHGLAMALIRSSINIGATRAEYYHGYYLTPEPHWEPKRKMESWYRPINVKAALKAGFQMDTFNRGQKNVSLKRLGLIYYVKEPNSSCVPVDPVGDYTDAVKALKQKNFYMAPSMEEWQGMCRLYDIYRVVDDFFFLFITEVEVIDTKEIVNNAYLALATSPDLLQHALWVSKQRECVLLCGLYFGYITHDKVFDDKGSTTTAESYLEMYNCRKEIDFSIRQFHLPIF